MKDKKQLPLEQKEKAVHGERIFPLKKYLTTVSYTHLNAAVIIAMEYTSDALHPRDKSLIGAFNPRRIGPYASKLPRRCAILYPIFPALISGKIKVFACPATLDSGHLVRATLGDTAASN